MPLAPPPVVSAITERYKLIGGRSPLPDLVNAQARALEKELGGGFRVYEGSMPAWNAHRRRSLNK